ncbi:MAG: methylenetetrahydrofolate--tRNA-(uracil(54)-C(5))-methyltransferase (FADH(2)-oxidizing) TrmFO [Anaerolineae bacterium]|nr:methylenetetrahydrofolate--tRNA-(uracil(54)-C(5))-methyltransferase (FADH(2)-oxidizing) TrmFO [Candidatus Roseilinea sp.]MDW8449235.1 methylenetetrahydrofolate--tRNA-(uracil(54)-C(5))-methyltransferase (FADH(2)-oxidizing) TrmFO [Anaerolineae bacterium]
MRETDFITVIGGGLAGTEAAWQIAQRGVRVKLYEMRPHKMTPAHTTGHLAELVCSNSLGADQVDKAPGLLKREMRMLGSLMMACAERAVVPAGGALAVDRERFALEVTRRIESHPLIEVIREEATRIPEGVSVIASGPLTSDALAAEIARLSGSEYLYFWDAIAPIVTLDSIDFNTAFRASRYGKEMRIERAESDGQTCNPDAQFSEGDYINCPMTRDEYYAFVEALVTAETATLRDFELRDERFFEGCLPIEVLARRGKDALAFGPMRPVGIRDPRTGKRPFAVVQLRQDNVAGTLYNIVGFQTNLKFSEQDRVLRMIPGLQNAEFVRYGQMHRNTFINSPVLLDATLRLKQEHLTKQTFSILNSRFSIFFAGQIVGVEGYVGNAATGLLAGINAVRALRGAPLVTLPPTTMLGALCHYIAHADPKHFQPMKANFGILPPLAQPPRDKRLRGAAYAERAQRDLQAAIESQGILSDILLPIEG